MVDSLELYGFGNRNRERDRESSVSIHNEPAISSSEVDINIMA